MHRTPRTSLRAAPALLALCACASVDSADVRTSGMYASFTATTDGTASVADAVLRVGGASSNTFVSLSEGDELSVTVDGTTTVLEETRLGDYSVYSAAIAAFAEDTVFDFAFTRATDDSAPSSPTSLPAPFALSAPVEDQVWSRAEDLVVSWEPSGEQDTMLVELTSDCTWPWTDTLDGDPGTVTIPADEVEVIDGHEDLSCAGAVRFARRRAGTLDAAFGEGGSVYGIQARTVDLRADP
jgi:hypothetical protein